jgi:hypothetical protein
MRQRSLYGLHGGFDAVGCFRVTRSGRARAAGSITRA